MNGKKWDVYVYGDVNVDLMIPGVTALPKPGTEQTVPYMETFVGGGAALFALGEGKLGLSVVFQGAVGNDVYGGMIKRQLEMTGVDTALLEQRETDRTGISLSFTDERDRCFLTYQGPNARLHMDNVLMEQVGRASHIHVTGYAGAERHEEYFRLLKRIKTETDTTISFDVGWDASGEWTAKIYELLPYIDVLFMNETESVHYSRRESAKEAAEDFAAHCRIVVIKLGSKGAIAFENGVFSQAAAFRVQAVDTTGAGDSFNAGFIYGFLRGKTVEESLRCANGCGALSVTAFGGNTAFPTEEALKAFLAERGA